MSRTAEELSCQELVELVTDYLEGVLDPSRLAALDAHLAACDGCDTYVEQMRQTVAALRGLGDGETLFPQTRETVLAALARDLPPRV
jgi:anti-sigma factor RsiW